MKTVGDSFFDFNDTQALVTGGSTGLGLEIARALLKAGSRVAIASRDEDRLKITAARLSEETGSECLAWTMDIASETSVRALADRIHASFSGKLNIVVNCSGYNVRNRIENVSLAEWQGIQDTNLTGAFLLSREMYPFLKSAEFARLIHFTSIFSRVSFAERASYAASKGGLLMLAKTLALEWAKDRITVNTISPGPFLTEINRKVLDHPENYRTFCQNIPLGRFGNPEEIVPAALFLASRGASYVTGSDVLVDGGWTAG